MAVGNIWFPVVKAMVDQEVERESENTENYPCGGCNGGASGQNPVYGPG
jgi:hypothetical protein